MKPSTLLAALAILLLAAFLRFHQLGAQSFWNDEGNSARLSERPIAAIIEGTASDVHPPLYYLLLHSWRTGVGSSEFGLRAFSALAGVLTLAVTMALARSVSRSIAAAVLVAGLLAAVSPPLVYYAQETRMYALLAFLAAFSTWSLWNSVAGRRHVTHEANLPWLAAYGLSIAMGLYTHYFFPAVIMGQGLLVGLYVIAPRLFVGRAGPVLDRRWTTALGWGGAVVAALLAYAIWVPIFLRQVGGRSITALSLRDYLGQSGAWLGVGTTLPFPTALWPLAAGLLLILLGLVMGRRRAVVPLVMAAVPIGGSFLAGATDPAFFKFLLTAVPFLCILAALAWAARGWSRVGVAVLTVMVVAGNALSLANMFNDPIYARADYRGIAERIAAEAYPNAAIILNAPNQWEVFTYYHQNGAPVFPLPKGQPDPALVEPELASIAVNHDRIYALFWGDAQRDPEHVVERWLDANTFRTAEEWIGDVRFVTYTMPSGDMGDLTPADFTFQAADGATITLGAFAYQPAAVGPGEIVQVQLEWSSDAAITQPYKVFVHLIDNSGQPIAQRDSEPAGGQRPTTSWLPGEAISDNYGLSIPAGASPGSYRLVVGLYDPLDPAARLPVTINGTVSDSAELGPIIVR